MLVKPPTTVDAYGIFCFEQCKLGYFHIKGDCGIGQNCPLSGDNGPVGVAIPNRPCRIPFIAGWHLRVRGHQKSNCDPVISDWDSSCSKCVIGFQDRKPSEVHPSLEYYVYANKFECDARENTILLYPTPTASPGPGEEWLPPDTLSAGAWVDFPIVPDLDCDGNLSCAVTKDECVDVCPPNSKGKVPAHCVDEDDMRHFCGHKPMLDVPDTCAGDRIITNDTSPQLLEPGRYGEVKVAKNAQVALAAGDYIFAELRVDKAGTLVAVGPVDMIVTGTTSFAGHFYAVPYEEQPNLAQIFTEEPHQCDAPPARVLVDPAGGLDNVTFGTNKQYDIDLCYPRAGGIISPGQGNTIRGRLVAWKVLGGENNEFLCEAFCPSPTPTATPEP